MLRVLSARDVRGSKLVRWLVGKLSRVAQPRLAFASWFLGLLTVGLAG